MVMSMPQSVKCSRCERCFPPGAVMQNGGKTIPALVVPQEVDSAQAAIAATTCQVCLERQGDPARGLKRVLEQLGVSDTTTVPVGRHRCEPVPDPGAAVGRRRSFAPPSLADVTIVVPGARREYTPSRPVRMSKPLPAPPPQQQGRAREDRRADNKAALAAAAEALAARREAERQAELERRARERAERQKRFDRSIKTLRLMMLRTRRRASVQDVDPRIVVFDRKLRAAAGDDAQQRDKLALMELVGTSMEELVRLSRLVYLTMSVEPYEPNDFNAFESMRFVPREDRHIRKKVKRPRTCEPIDVFVDGIRPEHWTHKSRDPLTSFYEVEVLRTSREYHDPNPVLRDSDPKIVYPQGGAFGGTYTVKGGRPTVELLAFETVMYFAGWLDEHHESLGVGSTSARVEIPALLAEFLQEQGPYLCPCEPATSEIESDDPEPDDPEPELSATT